eukprot:TRINITY_DN7208_c1_g1_i1.p1 TRINITY_DN7208_c1_g1~~TRINITY_DN7208_c1_g1_i1.p1  ORF type:complete len:467 (+),score=54.43 TRINITY_DN7208_c1_g1_i1:193-1593(+)
MLGAAAIRRIGPHSRPMAGQALVFIMTYVAYAAVTGARLPFSIAKTSLKPAHPSADLPGWEPFNGGKGKELMGVIDTVYMFGYAGAMPFAGYTADRTNSSKFLSLGLCLVGVLLVFTGFAHMWNVHAFSYFIVLSFLGGCAQSVAYPCVISTFNMWFSAKNIGFTLGCWSSCSSVGVILGKLLCGMVALKWQLVFIYPGVALVIVAIVVFFVLPHHPRHVDAVCVASTSAASGPLLDNDEERQSQGDADEARNAVPLATILRIPWLASYAISTFLSKFAYYTFVFWLPFYLNRRLDYDGEKSSRMSTFFDWGGFIGVVVGGIICDRLRLRAVVLFGFQASAVPLLLLYMALGRMELLTDLVNSVVLFALGVSVTTPYSLITSVMASDLGRDPSLQGCRDASGTVTAILDGTGSLGAVFQGVIVGWASDTLGWDAVIGILLVFSALSAAVLVRPSITELAHRSKRAP